MRWAGAAPADPEGRWVRTWTDASRCPALPFPAVLRRSANVLSCKTVRRRTNRAPSRTGRNDRGGGGRV